MREFRRYLLLLGLFVLIPGGLQAQSSGTITGTVVEEGSQRPLSGVQIFVVGTQRGSLSNQSGEFTVTGVPAGEQQIRATLVGFAPNSQTVTVTPGQAVSVNFSMTMSAVELGAVIVTATGQQQSRREIGNAVSTISVAEDVELAAVRDVSDVLQGRSAGVSVVSSGGTVGGGARIRVRGSNSVSLDNDPLLVIDGVRAESGMGNSIAVGGQTPNRLSDISPEDIESIDVLKGPAASALYGTAASNGVVVVTTKRGRAGDTQWRFYTEQGLNEDVISYPGNFDGPAACLTYNLAAGADCDASEIISFNPLENSETTPFQTGHNQKYGMSVTGGNEGLTYYVSGDIEDSQGVYRYNANSIERINLRANMQAALRDNLNASFTTGYLTSDLRLPQNDNNTLGLISGALLGYASPEQGVNGYLAIDPEQSAAIDTRQNTQRFIGGVTLDYQPLAWLGIIGTAGMDVVDRHDNELIPPATVFFSSLPEGERTSNRIRIGNYTANLGATANYPLSESIQATTSIGTQYNEEIFRGTYAFGAGLLAGSGSLEGTTHLYSVGEENDQLRTLGGYFQQQVAFNDRLYLTGSVRADDNSAFGEDFDLVYYPSLSASWVLSEEPFFPQIDALSSLRLRAAWGRAGRQPGSLDAVRYFSPVAVSVQYAGNPVPGYTVGGFGNQDLKPEVSSEIELGFDTGLLEDRLGLEFTYFNKTTNDLLIARRLAPSLGQTSTQFVNLGEVNNSGFEALVNADLIRSENFQWNVTLTGSLVDNELIRLGEGIEPIIFGLGGNTQRHQEGYPLGAYFQETYTYNDADGDGLLGLDDVELTGETEFIGTPFPRRQFSIGTNLTLGPLFRLSALIDHQGGHHLFNSTAEFRCGLYRQCDYNFDPNASLEQQGAYLASALYNTAAGFIEPADFTKLREVSLTFMVPQEFASRLGAGSMNLVVSGRNLATWTDYSGFDPEMNFAGSGSNFSTADFLTQPPYRTYTVRLDLTF